MCRCLCYRVSGVRVAVRVGARVGYASDVCVLGSCTCRCVHVGTSRSDFQRDTSVVQRFPATQMVHVYITGQQHSVEK